MYRKILVAMELASENEQYIIDKVKSLGSDEQTEVYAVHAIENIGSYVASYAVSAGIDIEKVLREDAHEKMAKVAASLNLDDSHQIIKLGAAFQVILDVAKEVQPDLIVVGSHGKSGLRLLLGSTANAVIHHSELDVLAVRAS